MKKETKEHIKLNLCYHKIKIITIINNFVGHKNWIDTCDVRNTAVLRVYKFYVAIYCTRIYLRITNYNKYTSCLYWLMFRHIFISNSKPAKNNNDHN